MVARYGARADFDHYCMTQDDSFIVGMNCERLQRLANYAIGRMMNSRTLAKKVLLAIGPEISAGYLIMSMRRSNITETVVSLLQEDRFIHPRTVNCLIGALHDRSATEEDRVNIRRVLGNDKFSNIAPRCLAAALKDPKCREDVIAVFKQYGAKRSTVKPLLPLLDRDSTMGPAIEVLTSEGYGINILPYVPFKVKERGFSKRLKILVEGIEEQARV